MNRRIPRLLILLPLFALGSSPLLLDRTLEGAVEGATLREPAAEVAGPGSLELSEEEPEPPHASFRWDPQVPPPACCVTFRDTSDGEIDRRSWDFGDGSTQEFTRDPGEFLHHFEEPGVYRVELTVRGPGGSDTAVHRITVARLSLAPAPEYALFDEVVTFTASAEGCTPDPQGWLWEMAGGEPLGPTGEATLSLRWPAPAGSGTKKIVVRNRACGERWARHILTVRMPTITITGPREVTVEEPAVFEASAMHCTPRPGGWEWGVVGDGTIVEGAGTDRVTVVWPPSDGFSTDNVSVRNDGCVDGDRVPYDAHVVLIHDPDAEDPPDPEAPRILGVTRELPGFFLDGTEASNRFDVRVDWRGEPGRVRFLLDGSPVATEAGDADGAVHSFRMDRFEPALEPSRVEVVAVSPDGVESPPATEEVYVFPHPRWLDDALADGDGFLQSAVEDGSVVYRIEAEYPDPHLAADGPIHVPSWVPFLGGRLGLTETFVRVDGEARSTGTGELEVFGQTGFAAAGGSVGGTATGHGAFRFFDGRGLTLTSAAFTLDLEGSIPREMKLLDAIPGIRDAESLPGVGSAIREVNDVATLTGTITPGLGFGASFAQDDEGDLVFREATGKLSLGLDAAITVPLDSLTLSAFLAGGGRVDLGVPGDLVRRVDFWAEVGASAEIDLLFKIDAEWAQRFGCTWEHDGELRCGRRDPAAAPAYFASPAREVGVRPIHREYRRFGELARLAAHRLTTRENGGPPATAQLELVRNVFPGASPRYVALEEGAMVLWEHQDPDDPIHQSLEIAWSLDRGDGWSPPRLVTDDTRVDLSPAAAVDGEGRVVAAWLRVADPAHAGPIETLADVAELHRQLEVVTAVFDPAAGTWSETTQLTDDRRAERDLHLASDGDGNLLLTWISSPDDAMISTSEAPADLRFSFWDAAAHRWTGPGTVAGALAGAVRHASDVHGDRALVALERKAADGTRGLELFRWTGERWTEAGSLSTGAADDRAVQVAYDAGGAAHGTWLRDGALVHSRLDRIEPVTVMARATSLGLLGSRLLASPDGHLALVWADVGDSGTADAQVVVFDGERRTWSAARTLAGGEEQVREIQGLFDRRGHLHLAFVATELERHDETVEIDGVPRVIRGIPSDGRSDLRLLEHELTTDLALRREDVELDPRRPEPGQLASAALIVRNVGDFAVEDVLVDLYAGDPASGAEVLLASARIAEPIPGGGTARVELPFTHPAAGGDLLAVVDPAGELDERTHANNRAALLTAHDPPRALAVADPVRGEAPLTVRFDAGASVDPEGQPLSFRWIFGDGTAAARGPRPRHTFTEPGRYPVTVLVSDGDLTRTAVVQVEVEERTVLPPPSADGWLSTPAAPGFELQARISGGGEPLAAALEPDCIPETICLSGALPGRAEAFVRVVGPKPNGRLWPTLVKFTTSTLEVWLRQVATGVVRYYRLDGVDPGTDELPGLFDRDGFEPTREASRHDAATATPPPPPSDQAFTSDHYPDFRFWVRIISGGTVHGVRQEPACIEETSCFSGAVPGRSEVFLRIVGPKPNGRLWPTIVKFTTSEVEVWIEQISTGAVRHYRLEGAAPGAGDLTGLFDRDGFVP